MKKKIRVEDGGTGRKKQRGHYRKVRSYSTHQHTLLFSSLLKLKKRNERENPGCTEKQGYNLREKAN